MNPIISVIVITYNHEKFIEKTLASIVEQKVDVSYEIVIGEDSSKDKTRKVIERFIENNSSIEFNLLPATPNKGMQKNLLDTYRACKGKYLAYCEGDDFWIDNNKLQKQFNFLEKNVNYVAVAHNSYKLYENWNSPWVIEMAKMKAEKVEKLSGYHGTCGLGRPTQDMTFEHFLYEKWPFHAASVFFKNLDLSNFPKIMTTTATPDKVMFVTLLHHGKFHFENQIMGVYRIHEGGITNQPTNSILNVSYYLNKIETVSSFYNLTDPKEHSKITRVIAEQYLQVAIYEKGMKRFSNLFKAIKIRPIFLVKKIRIVTSIIFRTVFKR